jgi:hypothetical protein
MNDNMTTASVQEFLKDFLTYSETQILEEGKEKDDILEVAKARGYNLQNNPDLAGFKTIFTFADKANQNRARLPKEKLLKALPGMIGKPVDIDHIRNFVVGHYIDYRYIASEDMVIAYGVFYKSNFGEEWNTAKKLFKAGKLGTSYEIWCPKNKRKYLPDGTYELTEMEIAGGGLMFKEKPAFSDAKVLEIAKKHIEEHSEELVFASVKKYNNEEIITSSELSITDRAKIIDKMAFVNSEPIVPAVSVPIIKPVEKISITPEQNKEVVPVEVKSVEVVAPIIPKIKCQNCQQEFDNTGMIATQSEKKCSNCKAIVNEQGAIIYPPQIIDFNMSCPSCRSSNWLLKSNTEDVANVKCMTCKKEYNFGFDKHVPNEMVKNISFVYMGSTSCPQCNTHIPFSTVSKSNNKSLICPSCQLGFNVDISKIDNKKKISKIDEIADMQKASAEGENKEMEKIEEVKPIPEAPVVEATAEIVPAEPVIEVMVPVVEVVEKIAEVVEVVVEAVVPEVVEPIIPVEVVPAEVKVDDVDVTPVVPETAKKSKDDEEEQDTTCAKCGNKKALLKKAAKKIRELKKCAVIHKASVNEIEVVKLENDNLKAKIQLLEISAVKVIERKNMLGGFSKDLSDKDILDDGKFEVAKLKKENAELQSKLVTASTNVSVKSERISGNEIAQIANNIDKLAYKK